jgi:hypothetical protein
LLVLRNSIYTPVIFPDLFNKLNAREMFKPRMLYIYSCYFPGFNHDNIVGSYKPEKLYIYSCYFPGFNHDNIFGSYKLEKLYIYTPVTFQDREVSNSIYILLLTSRIFYLYPSVLLNTPALSTIPPVIF